MVIQEISSSIEDPHVQKPAVELENCSSYLTSTQREMSLPGEECDNLDKEVESTSYHKNLKRKKSSYHVSDSDAILVKKCYEISKNDIEELRTVYNNCKSVMHKIESKYGHLLDLENSGVASYSNTSEEECVEKCDCKVNKKIVFDESGNEITTRILINDHLCPSKNKSKIKLQENVVIEYRNNCDKLLPDDISSLQTLLKNPEINTEEQHLVIKKIKMLREEYLNEIKYDKQTLVKQLKEHCNEVLDFKGTNMSSLPGYKV